MYGRIDVVGPEEQRAYKHLFNLLYKLGVILSYRTIMYTKYDAQGECKIGYAVSAETKYR